MKNPGYLTGRIHYHILFVIALHFAINNCYAQKDVVLDKNFQKIPRVTIPVKLERFRSTEMKNAIAEYRKSIKSGPFSKSALFSLTKKGYSNTAILATVRHIQLPDFAFNIITNIEIAEDAQLMLKAIPTLTAADMITAVRDLYDVSTTKLFDIALLVSQDSTQRIVQSKSFSFRCDCKIRNPNEVTSFRPFRKSQTESHFESTYKKKLYPWECFDYWNTGFRSVVLPETNFNDYLRLMRISEYPLYGGMLSTDLADSTIDFKIIMGTTAESLSELMELATLAYLPPASFACEMEIPASPSLSLNSVHYDSYYNGTCKHGSVNNTRFYLKDLLNVLKRNGFSVTILATAVKTGFNPQDNDMKQKILASFETSVFSAAEILQASNVLNSN